MGIAMTLKDYLNRSDIEYQVVAHPKSGSSLESARLAHVPGDCLAKTVVLEDDGGYLIAVVPSTHRIRLGVLSGQLNRAPRLATEPEFPGLFKDCVLGAIPPVGQAYGLPTVVEADLAIRPDIYFEAGDHEELIHMTCEQFMRLMTGAEKHHFSTQI